MTFGKKISLSLQLLFVSHVTLFVIFTGSWFGVATLHFWFTFLSDRRTGKANYFHWFDMQWRWLSPTALWTLVTLICSVCLILVFSQAHVMLKAMQASST